MKLKNNNEQKNDIKKITNKKIKMILKNNNE